MKATINESGVLIVEPEMQLERYALKKWRENFNCGDYSSLLQIDAVKAERPEE